MEGTDEPDAEVRETVALTDQLAKWLRNAGVQRTDMSVDIVDVIAGAKHVDTLVRRMLMLNSHNPTDAEQALNYLGKMHAWLFTEMRQHLDALQDSWPELEERLDALAPPEQE